MPDVGNLKAYGSTVQSALRARARAVRAHGRMPITRQMGFRPQSIVTASICHAVLRPLEEVGCEEGESEVEANEPPTTCSWVVTGKERRKGHGHVQKTLHSVPCVGYDVRLVCLRVCGAV